MTEPKEERAQVDSGLACLAMLARFHGVAADPAQLVHHFDRSDEDFDAETLLCASKYLGLKAKLITRDSLHGVPLPAMGRAADGGHFIIAKVAGDSVLVQDPTKPGPDTLSAQDFADR